MTYTCDKCMDTGLLPCSTPYCSDDTHEGECVCPAGQERRAEWVKQVRYE